MLQYKNTGKEHYNVVIATPGSNMTTEYVKSLLTTIKVLEKENISWIYLNEYSPIVTNAREATLCDSNCLDISNKNPGLGKFTYDKIFLIDSDIVWSPENFLKLFNSDKDIISGVYYDKTGQNAMIHHTKESKRPMDRSEVFSQREPFLVYGFGLGYTCIKNGVFEKLDRPWFRLGTTKIEVRGKEYNIPVGEDLFFCERISNNGYGVWVDPEVSVGHVKSNIIF